MLLNAGLCNIILDIKQQETKQTQQKRVYHYLNQQWLLPSHLHWLSNRLWIV